MHTFKEKTMKKIMIMAAMLAALTSCEKVDVSDLVGDGDDTTSEIGGGEKIKTKKFTFTMKGGFEDVVFYEGTRGYLADNAEAMADLWVFDFVDGECVQYLHQVPSDEGWGKPSLALSYGTHHVYFVSSAGVGAAVDADAKTIIWDKVRDTFWKDYEVNVVSTSNGNRAVTLERVVTKLRVLAVDEVPVGCSTVEISPTTWHNGMSYVTGEPTASLVGYKSVVNVPASYIGTSGQLAVSMFSLSGGAWNTDITITAKDGDGIVIGQSSITSASMKSNRMSEYSGNMFNGVGEYTLSLDSDWETHYQGTW